jgi:eukaryotic-like serine/threonine-protein kinase
VTADPRASRLGELVGGKYKLVRFMAEGGMGVVYEAQHAVVRRRFALKFLRPHLAERRDFLDRFRREAEAAGALENEHVAAAVDFGITADGAPYIVMEHLVGESLGSLLEREKRLPSSRAAELIRQACGGIQAAHAAGIVHRDLKPHNLFVCRRQDGTDLVKVLDFGVAKLQGADQTNAATGTGTVMGTAPYMSPEQARGENLIDSSTDVYALGAILYELLSGRRPHPGDSHNAILHHIGTQPAVPLALVRPRLPDGLAALVERTLSPDPRLRPSSAESLGAALAAWARREVWPEAPPVGAATTEDAPAAAVQEPSPASPKIGPASAAPVAPPERTPAAPAPPRGRRGALLLAAAALAIVAIAVAAVQRRTVAPVLGGAGHAEPRQLPPPPPTAAAISPGPSASVQEEGARQKAPEVHPPSPPAAGGHPAGRPGGRPPAVGRSSGGPAAATARPGPPPPRAPAAPRAESTPGASAKPRPAPQQAAAPVFDPENPYDRR